MIQHRFRIAALIGQWRLTRKAACREALKAGQARPDKHEPDESGQIQLNDRVTIEEKARDSFLS